MDGTWLKLRLGSIAPFFQPDRMLLHRSKPIIKPLTQTRPIFLSTYPPEECGLATFTRDSLDAVDMAAGRCVSSVMAIEKIRAMKAFNERIVHLIDNEQPNSYQQAARVVNAGPWNVVSFRSLPTPRSTPFADNAELPRTLMES